MEEKTIGKHISVIGLGYVGLPLAILAAEKGYIVHGIDTDPSKIAALNKETHPVASFSSDFSSVRDSEIVLICVPTPVHNDHTPDLGPVISATESIAPFLKRGQLIILESTVNPGVSEEIVLPILEGTSGLKVGRDFYLAHCPERINPGDPKWKVNNIPRVLGSADKKGLDLAMKFYNSILDAPVMPMATLREAEAVKVVENSFRDINIAFVNELAMSFSQLGIDVMNVLRGAATKPFGFMPHFPSRGVGGHCIPVDPYYLIQYAEKNGFHHDFLSLARKINNHMPEFTVSQLVAGLNEKSQAPKGTLVAVLGLAYKPNIEDTRESPAFEIIKHLKKTGAKVRTFDPYVSLKQTVKSLDEALSGATAAIIATAHDDFKKLTPKYFLDRGVSVVIDGCNCLPKADFLKSGIIYRGIGI